MNRRRNVMLPAAAMVGMFVVGGPSMARPGRNAPPAARYEASVRNSGEGFQEADIALRQLNLTGKQRDKIHKAVEKYSRKIEDARRDRNLAPSKREDRIWKARRDLRNEVMKALTKEQRERVDSIARRQDRNGRGPAWPDRPGNGPGWRR
jgi:Spy/CpxP family protein refolding chaperone